MTDILRRINSDEENAAQIRSCLIMKEIEVQRPLVDKANIDLHGGAACLEKHSLHDPVIEARKTTRDAVKRNECHCFLFT